VRRLRPTVVTYNAMINACSRRWEEAIWWFSALEKRGEERKEERPQPSVISYNSLMTVLGTNSLWVQALSVWQQMMREGLQPSVMTISTLGRHLRGPGALRLLSLCNEADVRPDLILCNTVLENCQRMLRWQQALAVLQEMPWKIGITPDEVSYNTAVNALELSDAWSTAVQLLRQMRCEDLQPSTVTYNSTMGALKKSLLWQRTMSLWQELAEDGHRLSEVTGDIAVTALSCSHRWAAAVALVDSQPVGAAGLASAWHSCEAFHERRALRHVQQQLRSKVNTQHGEALMKVWRHHEIAVLLQGTVLWWRFLWKLHMLHMGKAHPDLKDVIVPSAAARLWEMPKREAMAPLVWHGMRGATLPLEPFVGLLPVACEICLRGRGTRGVSISWGPVPRLGSRGDPLGRSGSRIETLGLKVWSSARCALRLVEFVRLHATSVDTGPNKGGVRLWDSEVGTPNLRLNIGQP
ncbi:Pentatricopeptide repeat-containing protein At1g09900, partial [Durusdinium trenchii]